MDEIKALDVQLIGASVDKPAGNTKFAAKHDLKMPLICDVDFAVASAFSVARPMVGVAKRATFLIDPDGTVRKVYTNVKARGHAEKVLEDARELWG
jgi:peroxiredoxin Q/BCP